MSDVVGRNAWLANMAALGAGGGSSGEPAQTADSDHQGMAAISTLQSLAAVVSASAATIPVVDEPSKFPEPRGVGLSISPLILKQMEDEVVKAIPRRRLLGQSRNPSFLSLLLMWYLMRS